ncbi:hypothetical protein EBZ38_13790 [bacterium]|nr:hypothetical protein [bacterium]NDC94960.1 hypothetical protein [bacterium]NDD85330.1 hypothetical protein [bacterium]
MRIIDRIALNRLIVLITGFILKLAKILSKNSEKVIDAPVVKPKRPKPLKRVVDTINNIIPLPWRE